MERFPRCLYSVPEQMTNHQQMYFHYFVIVFGPATTTDKINLLGFCLLISDERTWSAAEWDSSLGALDFTANKKARAAVYGCFKGIALFSHMRLLLSRCQSETSNPCSFVLLRVEWIRLRISIKQASHKNSKKYFRTIMWKLFLHQHDSDMFEF